MLKLNVKVNMNQYHEICRDGAGMAPIRTCLTYRRWAVGFKMVLVLVMIGFPIQRPVYSSQLSAVPTVSDLFDTPPIVLATHDTVFLKCGVSGETIDVTVLDGKSLAKQGTFRIAAGQGPCESNGLELVGAMDNRLFFLRWGRELVAYDRSGKCRVIQSGLTKDRPARLLAPFGKPDSFVALRLRFRRARPMAELVWVKDFRVDRVAAPEIPMEPLPPMATVVNHTVVYTTPAENGRRYFVLHLLPVDGKDASSLQVPFVRPRTSFEIDEAKAELKRAGMKVPDSVLKQKRLFPGMIVDTEGGAVFFMETVSESEHLRFRYIYQLDVSTGQVSRAEFPSVFLPREIIRGNMLLGAWEREDGAYELRSLSMDALDWEIVAPGKRLVK